MRKLTKQRKTSETEIELTLNLDGQGEAKIQTGIGFFDHMLEQVVKHGHLDLDLKAKGDLQVDGHHTIEDTGLALGEALREAVGDKAGINRYGSSFVPMDETLARVVLDLSGRPFLRFEAEFDWPLVGEYPCEMTKEFFRALASAAGLTLHAEVLYGENDHHKQEALYKALGRALRQAVAIDPEAKGIPSTKGTL